MIANAFSRPAISRRDVVVSLIALIPISTIGKELTANAFLNEIYRHHVGSSLRNAKGIELTDAKAVRSYFAVGLALLIIEDKALETKHGEPPVLDRDLFVGHQEWDISNLAIEVKQIGAFKAIGTVTFANDGKPEKVVLELQRLGSRFSHFDHRQYPHRQFSSSPEICSRSQGSSDLAAGQVKRQVRPQGA